MIEVIVREEPGGKRSVAARSSRPLRPAERRLLEDVVRAHPGRQAWDRAGVVVTGLWAHPARKLVRDLAAALGLELPA
ncbi:MAG: hypothetical protein AMXMBFR33_41380 [Candidatus Xenobia bacterium]